MRLITFNEMVPGMVLHPFFKGDEEGYEVNINEIIVLREVVGADAAEAVVFKGSRSIHYIPVRDAYMGSYWSAFHTGENDQWNVIDDQETLDKVRTRIKADINKACDLLLECERFVDENL